MGDPKGKCKCRVNHLGYAEAIIEYCPKHKAAPDMYEALKNLVNNLPESALEEAREIWLNTNTHIALDARAKAVQALAKADGGK